MKSKMIGGILMIVGTSIGAGMLALPVANATLGFWPSTVLLVVCWAFMTQSAFFILETNLYLPPGKNIISMAALTLGMPGKVIAWLSYLFLLYTLLSAYISGGSDVFGDLFAKIGFYLPAWLTSTLFSLVLGIVVYSGIQRVDWLNRGLMFAKLAAFGFLVILIAPYMNISHLRAAEITALSSTLLILITSFGFAIIIPSLRQYFKDDLRALRKVIFFGSLIPLICYIAWDAVIMGSLSHTGSHGLASLFHSEHTTTELADLLAQRVQSTTIFSLFHAFTSLCMLTAFLGVALCLFGFLSDGLNLNPKGLQGMKLFVMTFLPSLVVVIYFPGIYLYALTYAGVFCVILLLLLPALMVKHGRKMQAKANYHAPGGECAVWIVILGSMGFLLYLAWETMGHMMIQA